MKRPLRVLSIQSQGMGHGTYCMVLREHFAKESPDIRLDSFWLTEEREWISRLFYRLMSMRLPECRARRLNLDLHRFRVELALGKFGRRLAERKLASAERDGWPYDVLHFHTQISAWGSAALMQRIPTVLTCDMTASQISRETSEAAWQWTHAVSVAREKLIFRLARRVMFWSEWAAGSARVDEDVSADKVGVLHPGVPLFRFPNLMPSPRDAGPVRLLFVGAEWERKGGGDLLSVFQRDLSGNAELHFMTGYDIGKVIPGVHVHSNVTAYSAAWLELYRRTDIFVLPTRSEAFGLALIEAMAAELPVVATRINAITEIVEEGQSGLLIAPRDQNGLAAAIRTLIEDPVLRRMMGKRGREIVEKKFNAAKNFRQLRSIFEFASVA